MPDRTELCNSAVDAIGNTPLVALSRLTRDVDGRILAKLEYFNPGYSKGKTAVVLICDSGLKYLSTDLWE